MARVESTAGPQEVAAPPAPLRRDGRVVALTLALYLLAAVAVTSRLWADPGSRVAAGNPYDADQFAWFLRYAATAVVHGRLPALITTAMNPPLGVNLMWNTSLLLPGVLLTPVTVLAGPQTALTVLVTIGFAGSAGSLFLVLRRWDVSTSAAALGGAVYGFSPALLQAATGHYNLQFAVLPPLIVHLGLRLCTGSRVPLRDGAVLGLLITAQLFTGEELLMLTAIAGLLLAVVLAASRPRAVPGRLGPAAAGFAVTAGVALLLSGYALWKQFHGPLTQHGSAFTPDFFKNDVTGFVTPSGYLLFHTAGSAAAAARYQGGPSEYLGYLGWPLIGVLAVATAAFWRRPQVRATAVTAAVLELLSLGGHPLVGGTADAGVTLPWHWLGSLPLLSMMLANRMSIVADGAAAALLAFSMDEARARLDGARLDGARLDGAPLGRGSLGPARLTPAGPVAARSRRWAAWLPMTIAVLACLPLIPLPIRPATTSPLPAGWSAAFARLRLPQGAPVLVIPVPTATLTDPLRWQADTGEPGSLAGGYFTGPAGNGQAYIDGNGVSATAQYLDGLWSGGPVQSVPPGAQVQADLSAWHPAAVVAVTSPGSPLGRYLRLLFGPPSFRSRSVLAWRTAR